MPKNIQTTAKLYSSHMPAKYCSKFQKSIYFCFIDYIKTFDCDSLWITTNCGKFFKRWEYQNTLPAF